HTRRSGRSCGPCGTCGAVKPGNALGTRGAIYLPAAIPTHGSGAAAHCEQRENSKHQCASHRVLSSSVLVNCRRLLLLVSFRPLRPSHVLLREESAMMSSHSEL